VQFGSILTLSVGLAMDAVAVSAARGLATPAIRVHHAVRVAFFFGSFQAGMPVLGWLIGSRIGPAVATWDHWIAFSLLTGIGLKMLHEARTGGTPGTTPDRAATERQLFGAKAMLLLAVATSIDAFAVGVTLPMMDAPFALSIVTIGVTTAILSALGLVAGRRFGALLGRRLDAFGGIVLVALGTKILIEHLTSR
jgi:putative Mn2+ efflux pump MntP